MLDYYKLVRQFLRRFDEETRQSLGLWGLKLIPAFLIPSKDYPSLHTHLFDLEFSSPVGLAAGCDKQGQYSYKLLQSSLGFVEAGTVTLKPQLGNVGAKRLFELSEDKAFINRMGFPSVGIDKFLKNLTKHDCKGIIGINIGRNADSTDPINDYVTLLERAALYSDYIAVNVSSPNTEGLRAMQERESLNALLAALMEKRKNLHTRQNKIPPILLKIAPDLDDNSLDAVAEVSLAHNIDGLIVSNTTTRREGLKSENQTKAGGLSGRPLFALSTEILAKMYARVQDRIPLIGVGGIMSGDDAYEKICAGASLVQLYSGLVYHGPELIREIHETLDRRLKEDGFTSIKQAVGSGIRKTSTHVSFQSAGNYISGSSLQRKLAY